MEAKACGPMELSGIYGAPTESLNDIAASTRAVLESSRYSSMRIGIANDTALAREALRRVVLSLPANEVAWMAKDGAEAVAFSRDDAPDLILMDLFMPGTDGVEATRRIMGESPCAILIVTATIAGHLSKVYQAMGYGALDAIDTPTLGPRGEIAGAALLLHKIEIIGKLLQKPTERLGGRSERAETASSLAWSSPVEKTLDPLVVMGASTGGPQALAEVLSAASSQICGRHHHYSACRRCVCPGVGAVALRTSRHRVQLATEGHLPAAGEVLLSGTDDHLILGEDRRLHYSVEPRESSYRPSVDVFFDSAARNWPKPGVGVLLTGMLRDGASGLLNLRRIRLANDRPRRVVECGVGNAQSGR